MAIPKGRFVTLLQLRDPDINFLTVGKAYEVIAGLGEPDLSGCGGRVEVGGLNIVDDTGEILYIGDPTQAFYDGCLFGRFELVL